MDLSEIESNFNTFEGLLSELDINLVKHTELEAFMVRYSIVRIYACYQTNIKNMVISRAASTRDSGIRNYVANGLERKVDIDYKDLKAISNRFNSDFGKKLDESIDYSPGNSDKPEKLSQNKLAFDRIIDDRHKIAHKELSNLKISSLSALKEDHKLACVILRNFNNIIWSNKRV